MAQHYTYISSGFARRIIHDLAFYRAKCGPTYGFYGIVVADRSKTSDSVIYNCPDYDNVRISKDINATRAHKNRLVHVKDQVIPEANAEYSCLSHYNNGHSHVESGRIN